MTPLAAVSIAAIWGRLRLTHEWLAWMASTVAGYLFPVLALAELVTDKLPTTPSRKSIVPFTGRILSGTLAGAALGSTEHSFFTGALMGLVGAIVGTVGGYEIRTRLTRANGGKDLPIALAEDAVAILLAWLIVRSF